MNDLLSGISALEEVQNGLLPAECFRRKQAKEFVHDHIKQNMPGFYETIKKNILKTFSSQKPVRKLSVKSER